MRARVALLAAIAALVLGLVAQSVAIATPAAADGSGNSRPEEPRGNTAIAGLVLTPSRASIPARASQAYSAVAIDAEGHVIRDVTARARFSISPDGSCVRAKCTASKGGRHTVTASLDVGNRSVTAEAALDVVAPSSPVTSKQRAAGGAPGRPQSTDAVKRPLADMPRKTERRPALERTPSHRANRPQPIARLVLSPARTFIVPGAQVAYTAVAYDAAGRSLGDVTARTRFSMTFSGTTRSTAPPDGACTGATCTATKLGRHTVTGMVDVGNGTVSGTAAVQVVPRSYRPRPIPRLATIELQPASAVIESGDSITYVAYGYDADHRLLGDVTKLTLFTISPDGSCTRATCTATAAQSLPHTVTGIVRSTKRGLSARATLLVVPKLAGLVVEPQTGLTEVGRGVGYAAYGVDASGQRIVNLTDFARFSINPSGSCTGRTCTPATAGSHGVTGSVEVGDRTLSDTAQLRAIPVIARLSLEPQSETIRLGEAVSYTATGRDTAGRAIVDLTGDTVFSITSPGSCTGRTCTAATAQDYTVTGRVTLVDRTESASAELHVIVPAPPVPPSISSLRLVPTPATIRAGESVRVAATGVDAGGEPIGDLTADTDFTITAPGSCTGGTCTATRAQDYTVTGTVELPDGRTLQASVTLVVTAGPLESLVLDPAGATATAGQDVVFQAFGSDAFGNRLGEMTDRATFTITAPGSCSAATCTATKAQAYTVTATVQAQAPVSGTAPLEVGPGPLESLVLDPAEATATAGQDVDFQALGSDAFGNTLGEMTDRATFTITAPGSCSGATCRATTAQVYTVTASVAGEKPAVGTAALDVAAGALQSLVLDPPHAVLTAGQELPFRAYGSDAYGNRLGEVTDRTTIVISPEGSCTAIACTARELGTHTVTGTAPLGNGTASAKADVLVVATPIHSLRLNPVYAEIHPGDRATYNATAVDDKGRAVVDVTEYTSFSLAEEGHCTSTRCTASALGKHEVTGTVTISGGAARGTATLQVVHQGERIGPTGELANLDLSPQKATADLGAAVTYIAFGLDANGARLRDLTAETRFSIHPDGSCVRATCRAATAGPHTITGTIIGTSSGTTTGSATPTSAGGTRASRWEAVRRTPMIITSSTVTGSATLAVSAPTTPYCLVSPGDVHRLTVSASQISTGASVQVDGNLNPRLAACPVWVLVDGNLLSDTAVRSDGSVSADGTVTVNTRQETHTVTLITPDGVPIAARSISVTTPSQPPSLLWLLALALLLAAAAALQERARRQRRWVHQHVLVEPYPAPGLVKTDRDRDTAPTFTVRLRPQADPGSTEITQEGSR